MCLSEWSAGFGNLARDHPAQIPASQRAVLQGLMEFVHEDVRGDLLIEATNVAEALAHNSQLGVAKGFRANAAVSMLDWFTEGSVVWTPGGNR